MKLAIYARSGQGKFLPNCNFRQGDNDCKSIDKDNKDYGCHSTPIILVKVSWLPLHPRHKVVMVALSNYDIWCLLPPCTMACYSLSNDDFAINVCLVNYAINVCLNGDNVINEIH